MHAPLKSAQFTAAPASPRLAGSGLILSPDLGGKPSPPSHAVTGIEDGLALDGIPIARLLAEAKLPRSTWSRWRAGSGKPQDRWADVVRVYEELTTAVRSAVPLATNEAAAEEPAPARSLFVPIATAAERIGSAGHAGIVPDRTEVLAAIERHGAAAAAAAALDLDVDDDHPLVLAHTTAREALEELASRLTDLPSRDPADVATKSELAAALGGANRFDYEYLVLAHEGLIRSIIADGRRLAAGGTDVHRLSDSLATGELPLFRPVATVIERSQKIRSDDQTTFEGTGSGPDATLLSLLDQHAEAMTLWHEADQESSGPLVRYSETRPPRPAAVFWHAGDPAPIASGVQPVAGGKRRLFYTSAEIEQPRASPDPVSYRNVDYPGPDGNWFDHVKDERGCARKAAILAAWDAWQAEDAACRENSGLAAANERVRRDEAIEAALCDAIIGTAPATYTGLVAKALWMKSRDLAEFAAEVVLDDIIAWPRTFERSPPATCWSATARSSILSCAS